MKTKWGKIILLTSILSMNGCASLHSIFTANSKEPSPPIENPFVDYQGGGKDGSQTMILRTKKGDRSVELEIPGDPQQLSEFTLPVSPAFKTSDRNPASAGENSNSEPAGVDSTYQRHPASPSDHEILSGLPQGSVQDEAQRNEIEQGLNLARTEDGSFNSETPSYLASLDHVKQLYKVARFEAALLELDDMIRIFQTDPKLYEMRGTLLDRLGRRELALKSWNQALRFNPKNLNLKKFIERKQARSVAGGL